MSLRDAARFVGRSRELARLEALLGEDQRASVAIVHGPAGIGKSALMRELARRAARRGWTPLTLDARDIAPVAAALERALTPARQSQRPLVMLDSWERMAALDSHLRNELLPALAPDALVLLGTRRPPTGNWFRAGWEHMVLDLRIEPLRTAEAEALLAARGVEDPVRRASTADWARGSPLALALAAEAGGVPAGTATDDAPPSVLDRLLPRLLDSQEGERLRVLGVAALAHVTTPELLARALPGVEAERAFAWLREHPSAEPVGDGVMLHDLVGRMLRAHLRHRSPEQERDLRRRLVDALYARAISGGFIQFTRELQHLVQNSAIRWGFAWDASGCYRIDSPRAGDMPEIAARSGRAALAWLQSAEQYFRDAPERVTIVRDQDGRVAGYGIAVTPANVPAFAAGDPVLAPRVSHARGHVRGAGAVIWRQAVDLTRERRSPVIALIGMAGIIGSGLDNPTLAYLPIAHGDVAGSAFSAACGAVPVDELALEHAGARIECHLLDYGPGGVLAHQRATVYRELGLPPPPSPAPTLEAVREALRRYSSPALLAACPLAPPGGSLATRAAAARARIDEAVRDAFGTSASDQRLHSVLLRGYLDPAPTHELAAGELGLSRTAYFRRLRQAVERVAAQLQSAPCSTSPQSSSHLPPDRPAGAAAGAEAGRALGRSSPQ